MGIRSRDSDPFTALSLPCPLLSVDFHFAGFGHNFTIKPLASGFLQGIFSSNTEVLP